MKGVIRLTPIIPGQMQPVVFIDGKIRTGFIGGGATEGRGFPQWAMPIFSTGRAHWFFEPNGDWSMSLCGIYKPTQRLFLPGNYPRCKRCERALATQKRLGVR